MSVGICRSCGAQIGRPGPGRPRKLCDECRGGRYGGVHQTKRAREIESAYGTPCARCGKPMERGQELHLDHRDGGGPSDYIGFSHAKCNLSAASRSRAAANGSQKLAQLVARRSEPALCEFHDPPEYSCPHSRNW